MKEGWSGGRMGGRKLKGGRQIRQNGKDEKLERQKVGLTTTKVVRSHHGFGICSH